MKLLKLLAGLAMVLVCAGSVAADSPETDALRQKAVAWLKKNKLGAKDYDKLSQILDQGITQGRNFNLALGSNLSKSGKSTVAASWAGEMFVFTLSAKQAKDLGLKAMSATLSLSGIRADQRQSPDPITLSQLTIDNHKSLDGTKPIAGQVDFRVDGKVPEKVALRLSYSKDKTTTSNFKHLATLPAQDKTVSFSFTGMNAGEKDVKIKGPIVVFVDLCEIQNTAGKTKINVLGKPLALLVNVQ